MTEDKMREIILGAPLDELIKNGKIDEFYEEGDLSIGVCYQDREYDNTGQYIYNIFFRGEYINIDYYDDIDLVIRDLVICWNELKNLT